ncbi:metal-dependent hydrolase [Bdellovibrio sp. HCB337]|uniref:metal-dependent hydrolase n=1 Tax=Bdellovibrio sp. HCB337 TaxID=3394358 RepID=UPI0039A68652
MTHAVVGYTIARICVRKPISPIYWIMAMIAPMLPDLDVLGHQYGIRYQDCLGHRGASHSIAAAFLAAIILLVIFKLITNTKGFLTLKDCFWGFFLGIFSHCLLDALTNGGLGVAVFWPMNCARYFFPIRPLEVSPLSVEKFFEQGFFIMKNEFYYVWIPCLAILALDYAYQRFSIRNRS